MAGPVVQVTPSGVTTTLCLVITTYTNTKGRSVAARSSVWPDLAIGPHLASSWAGCSGDAVGWHHDRVPRYSHSHCNRHIAIPAHTGQAYQARVNRGLHDSLVDKACQLTTDTGNAGSSPHVARRFLFIVPPWLIPTLGRAVTHNPTPVRQHRISTPVAYYHSITYSVVLFH